MNVGRGFRRALPWLAAALAPASVWGVLYTLGGADLSGVLIAGLASGTIGLLGALAAELVRSLTARWVVADRLASTVGDPAMALAADPPVALGLGRCCEAGARTYPDPCPWHDE